MLKDDKTSQTYANLSRNMDKLYACDAKILYIPYQCSCTYLLLHIL